MPQPPELITLHGSFSSVMLELDGAGAPLWRYWGARLESVSHIPLLRATRAAPSFSLDDDVPLSLFPSFGVGWFGPSALLAHRVGADFAQSWTGCVVEWLAPERAVCVTLFDDVARLRVVITLSLDSASDILSINTTLTNMGAAPLDVQHLAAACLPLPNEALRLRHYVGRHNAEFQREEQALGRSGWRRENRRGLTGHGGPCGAVILRDDGGAWGAQLAWSGNATQSIDWSDDGQFIWQLGEWLAPGEVRLAPGESLATPDVLASFSPEGADGIARNFHAAIRGRMIWPGGAMTPRPVHFNTWEGLYFNHDRTTLTELAKVAAEIGAERFVLDDGWFHRRDDDTRGLGDWWPDADQYPDGLAPLAAHVTTLGMGFGLWVEPEMVNPDSDLFRAHPDWALHIAGRPLLTARHQLVLDLTRADVCAHLFGCLDKLLRTLPIRYLKWDHNRDLTCAGTTLGRAAYRAQVLAAYALFDSIRAAHPDIEIEACAGGGGRLDAGIITRTHRFWTSDCIDAVSRLSIQQGFLQFFPPELMGAHIGAAPAHSTGRQQSQDFRAAVALTGHLGVELDLLALGAAERARLAHWIALYKQFRDQLHHGAVYHGAVGDGVSWQAHGPKEARADEDWLLFLYRTSPATQGQAPPVRLPFLNSRVDYVVSPREPVEGEARSYGGAWLMTAGLPLPPMMAECALIYQITRA